MKKVCIVRQHDITDCGPACLSSIILFYGGYVPIEIIRLKCNTNSNGTSAYSLIEAAKSYNFDVKALRVNNIDEILKNYRLPCIVHLKLKNNLNHYVVLYEYKTDELILMDPSQGKVKMKNSDFLEIFTGVVLLMQPQSTLLKYEKPNTIYKTIISFFKTNKKITTKLLVYSVILVNISVIISYFLKYGSLVSNGDFGLTVLIYFTILYLYIYITKNYIEYIKNRLVVYMNKNISSDLYKKFSHQLFILPLNFIKSKSSGEIISRYNELTQLNQMIPEIIVSVSLDLIMAFVALIFSSFISIKLTAISVIIMIIYSVICFFQKNPTLQKINNNITLYSEFNTNIIDNVNAIISTKYLNNEKNMEERLEKSGAHYLEGNMNMDLFFNKCNFIKNIIYDIGKWLLLSYGLYLCFTKNLNIINLFTFEMVINYFFEPVKDINAIIPKVCFMKSSLYKLNEYSLVKEQNNGNYHFKPGNIEIKNLSFSYDIKNDILKDLNMNIRENEKVLIQGNSGSGKSTLCQILSKQIEYNKGSIKIANININDISIEDYRKNITYIGQKDSLLIDTILENIIYERKILDKDLKNICNICEIDEILDKKVGRFNTVINESSMNISGGEKQRIILARGLLKPGKIIILDEALSEVNKDMEERIIKRILKHFQNRTIIYVSHKDYKNIFERKLVLNS